MGIDFVQTFEIEAPAISIMLIVKVRLSRYRMILVDVAGEGSSWPKAP